jgi:hypothetical protein
MAVRRKTFYDEVMMLALACSLMVGLDGDLRTFPTARADGHGFIRSGCGRASTMRITPEGELPPTDFGPNKDAGCNGNDDQRDKLLPIHTCNVPENP